MIRAEDYFGDIRLIARTMANHQHRIDTLRSRAEIAYQSSDGVRGSSDMTPVLMMIAEEMELRDELEMYKRPMDEASAILYGWDGRGGLAHFAGTIYSDCICLVYMQDMDEEAAGDQLGYGVEAVKRFCRSGFKLIDDYQLIGQILAQRPKD